MKFFVLFSTGGIRATVSNRPRLCLWNGRTCSQPDKSCLWNKPRPGKHWLHMMKGLHSMGAHEGFFVAFPTPEEPEAVNDACRNTESLEDQKNRTCTSSCLFLPCWFCLIVGYETCAPVISNCFCWRFPTICNTNTPCLWLICQLPKCYSFFEFHLIGICYVHRYHLETTSDQTTSPPCLESTLTTYIHRPDEFV